MVLLSGHKQILIRLLLCLFVRVVGVTRRHLLLAEERLGLVQTAGVAHEGCPVLGRARALVEGLLPAEGVAVKVFFNHVESLGPEHEEVVQHVRLRLV